MTSDAFLIIFLVFLACITFFPAVLKRWGIPGVISLMLVGIIAGPNALNMLSHLTDSLNFLGNPEIVYNNFSFFIAALGSLGLVFLMALAGMEADFKLIDAVKKNKKSLPELLYPILSVVIGLMLAFGNALDIMIVIVGILLIVDGIIGLFGLIKKHNA